MSQDCAKSVLVALGGNLHRSTEAPEVTISRALKALDVRGLPVLRASKLYRTPSFPAGNGPDYVNSAACMTLRQDQSAQDILTILHEIEAEFGRTRTERWAGRTLDLDLLAMSDSILPDRESQARWRELSLTDQMQQSPDQLILPHPRMQDRAFVLVPLADVAPNWVHPVLNLSVLQMLARCPAEDVAQVTPFSALAQ